MVVKIYISGISGNKEVKKRQQRVLLILDSKNIKYEVIDIAEPGSEDQKDFMQNNSTSSGATISDPKPRHPLPPQLFNDDIYCGDYDQFDMANEIDEMEKFLKLAPDDSATSVISNVELKLGNGDADSQLIENQSYVNDKLNLNDQSNVDDIEVGHNETDDQKLENGNKQVDNNEDAEDEEDVEEDTSEKAEDV